MSNKKEVRGHSATIAEYQQVFDSESGKKVLRHLMRNCGMMQPSLDMKDCNPYATAFNEGRRAVVIEILQKLRIDLKRVETEIMEQPEGDDDVII